MHRTPLVVKRALFLLAGVVAGAGLSSAAGPTSHFAFAAPASLAGVSGTAGPVAIVSADLDFDQNKDLVVANCNDNSVQVVPGIGDGTFDAAVTYTAGTCPTALSIAQMSGDGNILNVVLVNQDDEIRIVPFQYPAYSAIDRSFGTATIYSTDPDPVSVIGADLNGDGWNDAAVATQNSIKIDYRDGSGTTSSSESLPAPSSVSRIATFGDLDSDGISDLVAGSDGSVTVFPTTSNDPMMMGFMPLSFPTDTGLTSGIAGGDLNGDHFLDLVSANRDAGTVSVLLGDGAGNFQSAVNFPVTGHPLQIAVADFNGDSFIDVAVVSSDTGTVSILQGDGTGGLGAAEDFPAGTGASDLAIADFNEDGKPDVATSNSDGTVSIIINQTPPPATLSQDASNRDLGAGPVDVVFTTSVFGFPTGASLTYVYTFGDGTTAAPDPASATITHSYTAGGTFYAHVTVSDGTRIVNSAPITVEVTHTISVSQSPAPTAALSIVSFSPSTGVAPLTVTFDGSQSYANGGASITGYTINFGDGTSDSGTGTPPASIPHTFTNSGNYAVLLAVSDTRGNIGKATASIQVAAAPGTIAQLVVSPTNALTGDPVTFDASGSIPAAGTTIDQYFFEFGDGTTASGTSSVVTHVYTHPGTYQPQVTVYDGNGGESVAKVLMIASVPPVPASSSGGGGALGWLTLLPMTLVALGRRRIALSAR